MWRQIGRCPGSECDDRLWSAGLSADGTKCFVGGYEDHVLIVWDIRASRVLWRDDGSDGGSEIQSLADLMDDDGFVHLAEAPVEGRYRIFGLDYGHGKIESNLLNRVLEVRTSDQTLLVRERKSNLTVCRLSLEALSNDWAFVSFSENDATIAVLEPYSVTFFAQELKEGIYSKSGLRGGGGV